MILRVFFLVNSNNNIFLKSFQIQNSKTKHFPVKVKF